MLSHLHECLLQLTVRDAVVVGRVADNTIHIVVALFGGSRVLAGHATENGARCT